MAETTTNSVLHLKTLNFPALSKEEQIKIKTIGRPTPNVTTQNKNNKNPNPANTQMCYEKFQWLCRCVDTGNFYCFPCILYRKGCDRVDGLGEGFKQALVALDRHAKIPEHMSASLELALLDTKTAVTDGPVRNTKYLEHVFDCVKQCGVCEEALEILLDSKGLTKPPENVMNGLLDCSLDVVRDEIKAEIKQAEFVSMLLEDVSDVSNCDQAVIFRYVRKGRAVERFWGLMNDADVVGVLEQAVNSSRKLTAQIYNPKFYNLGYAYRHCVSVHYPLNRPETVLAKAMPQDAKTRQFFARVKQIVGFCPEESLGTIYDNRLLLQDDLKQIRDTSKRPKDITTAIAILNSLTDPDFLSTLDFFSEILPHIETLHEESLLAIPSASSTFTHVLQTVQSSEGETIDEAARCNIVLGFSKMRAFKSAEEILNPQNWRAVSSDMICEACNLYPSLGLQAKQVTVELEVLHQNQMVTNINGAVELLKFLVDHDLKSVVPTIYTLALLVVTAPVVDQDGKKLKRVREVLESSDGRREGEIVLSVEKEFVMDRCEFTKKVIRAFEAKCQSGLLEFPTAASNAPLVQIRIPQLLIQVPVPFPVQCKTEVEDDVTGVPVDQISCSETDGVSNFTERAQRSTLETDPLAIGEGDYLESEDASMYRAPPPKKAKRNPSALKTVHKKTGR